MRRRGTIFEWSIPAGGNGSIGYEGQRLRPVRYAGVYVPGGKATYPSSVIMNAVPAIVAGVDRVVVATPARPDGTLNAAVLVAARELGISKIVKAGGAYGIGALAYGLGPSMPPCDVVAGPGNVYVNEAKRQCGVKSAPTYTPGRARSRCMLTPRLTLASPLPIY